MSLVCFLSTFILCLGVFSEGILRPSVVNVGAIFTFGTTYGKISEIAIRAAESDVNSDTSFLGGTKLRITMQDSNYSDFLSIMTALQFMETDKVAIIGPQNAVEAHVVSHLANELHIPLLSFTALDPTLSPLQYPFFVQTAPNDVFQTKAIAELVSYYGWKNVVAIYSDDDQCRNGITALRDQLAIRGSKISYKAVLPPFSRGNTSQVTDALLGIQMQESRIIVIYTYAKCGLMVFRIAQKLGMMKNGYVWIATTWLSSFLDSTSLVSSATYKSIEGVLTLRPHTPDSKNKRDFIARWNHLSNASIGLNAYGLYAYDTVWIIARAVKSLLDTGTAISFSKDSSLANLPGRILNLSALSIFDGGSQLLRNILETNMTGITGPIRFDRDRFLLQPSYTILNVLNAGYHRIGYWSNHSGLSVVAPETFYSKKPNRSISNQHLDNVVWPGGMMVTPRGWSFPENGERLRIGVPIRVSYKDFISRINGTDKIEGYCVDVFRAAIELLSYAVPYMFIPFGDGLRNPDYYEFVNGINTGVFDAAIGDISIVMNRTKIVDFTQPYVESGLVVVARVKNLKSDAWSFLHPFSLELWGATAAFFLTVGVIIWILEHKVNDDFRGSPKKQIITIIWFSFSTMFFAHRENVMSSLGRAVLIIWLFVVLILTSSYTASLTSIFTVQQLSSPIEGIDTLISSRGRIGVPSGSYARNYLSEQLDIPIDRLVALDSQEDYATALINGTVAAVVDERAYINLFLSDYCGFSIRGPAFTKSSWGFAFKRDSPLAVDMSTALLTLSENGKLQEINNKWLSRTNCSSYIPLSDSDQLRIQNFWGLYFIFGTVCILALFIYFLKTLREFWRRRLHKKPESLHSGSSHIRTFLALADEKKTAKRVSKRKRKDTSEDK